MNPDKLLYAMQELLRQIWIYRRALKIAAGEKADLRTDVGPGAETRQALSITGIELEWITQATVQIKEESNDDPDIS